MSSMTKNKKQKKELSFNRSTWENFRKLDLKAAIMKKHLEYQALYGDLFNSFSIND